LQRPDGVSDGLEVVDDMQVFEALRFAERAGGKRPAAVGELTRSCSTRPATATAARFRDAGMPGVALR
jgi:hypothetical protein